MENYFGKGVLCSDCASEQYLAVNNCGCYRNIDVEMHVFRPEGRQDYQYLYIDKGSGTFCINGEKTVLTAGSGVIYLPHETQNYTFRADGSDYYWIHFSGSGAAELLSRAGLCGGVFVSGELPAVREAIRRAVRLFRSGLPCADAYSEGLLTEILCETAISAHGKQKTMQNVIELMQKDGAKSRKMQEYAAVCGMSEYAFIRKFKEEIGKTPLQYRNELLMEKARDLFSKTEMNTAETAYFLGFDDPLYFSRVFKKETGLSPRQYRALYGKSI